MTTCERSAQEIIVIQGTRITCLPPALTQVKCVRIISRYRFSFSSYIYLNLERRFEAASAWTNLSANVRYVHDGQWCKEGSNRRYNTTIEWRVNETSCHRCLFQMDGMLMQEKKKTRFDAERGGRHNIYFTTLAKQNCGFCREHSKSGARESKLYQSALW